MASRTCCRPYTDELEIVELDTPGARLASRSTSRSTTRSPRRRATATDVDDLIHNPLVRRVVVYTWNIQARLIEGSLARGASAYLSKTLSGADLVDALGRCTPASG